jgi:ribokinase
VTAEPGTVCVLGSFMMDLSLRAPRRPRPGETVIGTGFGMFLGGKGFNQAVAARRAGATTRMVGRLGADDFGSRFLDCLRLEGIDAGRVGIDETEGTGIGAPLVEDSGENSIVVVPRANHRMTVADVAAAEDAFAASRVLLLLLELPIDVVAAAAAQAKALGLTVILNPAPARMDLATFAGLVDVLVPNEVEAMQLAGTSNPCAAAATLRHQTGAQVVVTLGRHGLISATEEGRGAIPAHRVAALDTVGAGDAFCGALGTRLAFGDSVPDAATYANAAAAVSVTRAGAEPSMPTRAEIDALLADAAPA